MMVGIELFGVNLPLWAIFLTGIIVVIVAWKVIKFAIKVLLLAVVVFVVLMGLDVLNVFENIQSLFPGLI
ncbi:MAG: hypothetical protein KAW45_05250 [Thermoplasmatales archaeon]|nr:hypothetical protein [Thermoplasmatales archaeon]